MKIATPIAAAVAVAAAISASASAQSVRIEFDRALLDTSEGRAEIYETFEEKSRQICKRKVREQGTYLALSGCTEQLVDSLVEDLNDARISTLHGGYADYDFASRQ